MVHKTTIQDVARVAGVSRTTVSKVLNDQPRVAPATRELVRSTMERLGYRPSAVAQGLRSQRSRMLALITDDIEGLFTAAMMRGVEEVVAQEDYGVLLCNSYGESDRERAHLQRLADRQIEGFVLMSGNRVRPRGGPSLPMPGVPFVYLYQYGTDGQAPSVLPDDRGGAALAIQHLAGLGRTKIAFINGPPRYEATHERRAGVDDAMRAAGLECDPRRMLVADDWYPELGFAGTQRLLAAGEPPDAIFCASDDLAAGCLAALHESDISIGDEVAVVGFDDRPIAAHLRPTLTTIRLPLLDMGRRAGRLLLGALSGDQPHSVVERLPCTLVERASSGRSVRTGR